MYKVLVVDDDATCLTVARACLRRYNYYPVIGVSHALEALSLLSEKPEQEKSYDVILADIHMPIMDGLELLQHVNNNFNIPVLLMSADDKTEVICKGFSYRAPTYLLKPVTTKDVKHLWQYSVLWKNKEKNAYRRFNQANVPRSICSSSCNRDTEEVSREKKTTQPLWKANLHNGFVEAILILGPRNVVPRNILEVMNVPSLRREQVAGHLQKFLKFMERVLDGQTSLNETSKYWIDCHHYSEIVGGNPNVILLNQLLQNRRTGETAAPIPASLPLPPLNETEGTSRGIRNVEMSMPNNYAFSCLNVATPTLGQAGVTFHSVENVCTENYYTVVPQQNYNTFLSAVNGGLMDRTNNSMFSSVNHIVPSSGTTPILNQFISAQPFNMTTEGNNILFTENNFNNVVLQMENEQLNDPNIGNSFGANQFEIPLGMNNEQVGSVPSGGTANEFGDASAMPTIEHAPQFGDYLQMQERRKEDYEDE